MSGFGDDSNLPREVDPWILNQIEQERKERREAEERHKSTAHSESKTAYSKETCESFWAQFKRRQTPWRELIRGIKWSVIFFHLYVRIIVSPFENFESWVPIGKTAEFKTNHKKNQIDMVNSKKRRNVLLHSTCPWYCCCRSTFPGCGRKLGTKEQEMELEKKARDLEEARDVIKGISKQISSLKISIFSAKKKLKASVEADSQKIDEEIKVLRSSLEEKDKAFKEAQYSYLKMEEQ